MYANFWIIAFRCFRTCISDLMSTLKLCGDDPLTDREAEELMEAMDTNKDGFIDTNGCFSYESYRSIKQCSIFHRSNKVTSRSMDNHCFL